MTAANWLVNRQMVIHQHLQGHFLTWPASSDSLSASSSHPVSYKPKTSHKPVRNSLMSDRLTDVSMFSEHCSRTWIIFIEYSTKWTLVMWSSLSQRPSEVILVKFFAAKQIRGFPWRLKKLIKLALGHIMWPTLKLKVKQKVFTTRYLEIQMTLEYNFLEEFSNRMPWRRSKIKLLDYRH